jgi:hypothetical protein
LRVYFSLQYYNAWVSLSGTLLCIAVMFLMSWVMALITFVVVITLYLYVSYRRPGMLANTWIKLMHNVFFNMFHPVVHVQLNLIKIGNYSQTQQFYYHKKRQCFSSVTEPSSGLCHILNHINCRSAGDGIPSRLL